MKINADYKESLSQEDCKRIANAYQSGRSRAAIAREFGCDIQTIGEVLKHLNTGKRFSKYGNFSAKECKKVVRMYEGGDNLADIAALYNCSCAPIRKILHKHGVVIRASGDPVFSPDEAKRIVELYHGGQTQKQIAKNYNTSAETVRKILAGAGVEVRPGGHFTIPPELYTEIKSVYECGATISDITTMLGCNRETVREILRRTGAKKCSVSVTLADRERLNEMFSDDVRKSGFLGEVTIPKVRDAHSGFRLTEEDRKKIIDLYKSGLTSKKIAEIIGCVEGTVYNTLHKRGVTMRFSSPAKLSEETYRQIATLYEAGQSSQEIADVFGCSANRILQVLHDLGIKPRRSSTPKKLGSTIRKKVDLDEAERVRDQKASRTKFSKRDSDRIAGMYKRGLTYAEIAAELNHSQYSIKALICKLNVQPYRQKADDYSEEDRRQMVELYERGVTQDEIAANYECRREIVNRVLQSNGIKIRQAETIDRFAPRDRRRMAILHKNGRSELEIAEEFKCDTGTVAAIIRIVSRRSMLLDKFTPLDIPPIPKEEQRSRAASIAPLTSGEREKPIKNELAVEKSQVSSSSLITPRDGGSRKSETASARFSIDVFVREFWERENRAVDVLMMPEEQSLPLIGQVNEALKYAYERLTKE